MLKIIIFEENLVIKIFLKKKLTVLSEIEGIKEAVNGLQLFQLVEEFNPDVVFLDLDSAVINGIEVAKKIIDINPEIFVILTSVCDSQIRKAFEVHAFNYLTKPFDEECIDESIRWIYKIKKTRKTRKTIGADTLQYPIVVRNKNLKLAIQLDNNLILINPKDIIFITRYDRKTVIYTTLGIVKTNGPLQEIEQQLQGYNFFRCHKGYIINAEMVTEITPWGNKTHLVKLLHTDETALITLEKVKEFRNKFCHK